MFLCTHLIIYIVYMQGEIVWCWGGEGGLQYQILGWEICNLYQVLHYI